jgi:hypothetical protein
MQVELNLLVPTFHKRIGMLSLSAELSSTLEVIGSSFISSGEGSSVTPFAEEFVERLVAALQEDGYQRCSCQQDTIRSSRALSELHVGGGVWFSAMMVIICVICGSLASGLTQVPTRVPSVAPSTK